MVTALILLVPRNAQRNGESSSLIFAEDLAALVGLVIAFAAVSVTWATGNPIFDAVGTVGIGVLLVAVAIAVAIEVKAMLIGQGVQKCAVPMPENAGVAWLRNTHVETLIDLLTLHMGADVMVAVKAKMRPAAERRRAQPKPSYLRSRSCSSKRFPQVRWVVIRAHDLHDKGNEDVRTNARRSLHIRQRPTRESGRIFARRRFSRPTARTLACRAVASSSSWSFSNMRDRSRRAAPSTRCLRGKSAPLAWSRLQAATTARQRRFPL